MHKLTPDVKKRLQEFAARITPPNQEPGGRPGKALTVTELKDRYGLTTDSKGQPLKAGQLYLAKDLPAVNQHRRLCKAYERGGWAEVEQYLQPYRTPAAIARGIVARAEAEAAAEAPAVVQLAEAGVAGYEQAIFEPLPDASDELRVSEPVREFQRLTERWTKEAEAEQTGEYAYCMPVDDTPGTCPVADGSK